MAIWDNTVKTPRHNFESLTPSQKSKQGQLDYAQRQQVAASQARAENARREGAKIREEKLVEESIHRLLSGVEVESFEDMIFLIGLVNNRGEEDTNHQHLGALDNYWDRQLEQQVNKLRREYMHKRNELDAKALEYFQKQDKRTCKKLLREFEGTPYEIISKRVDAIVHGDKGE